MPNIFSIQNRAETWTQDLPSRIRIRIKILKHTHESKIVMFSVGKKKKFPDEAEIFTGSVKLNCSYFGNCLYEFPLNM